MAIFNRSGLLVDIRLSLLVDEVAAELRPQSSPVK
jgi:hypothetical protein